MSAFNKSRYGRRPDTLKARFEQGPVIEKLFDKEPPRSIDAEMSLLGSMLLDWKTIGEVMQMISSADDFYLPKHQAIFKALTTLFDKHQAVDDLQVVQYLRDHDVLELSGGAEYIVSLVDSVPTANHAIHYAKIVRDKARLRQLITSASNILFEAYHSTEEVEKLIDSAEQSVFEIAQFSKASDPQALSELIYETFELLESRRGDNSTITGLSTGYTELDEYLSGLQKGEMIIIAARPSMGKTTFAMNIAENICIQNKYPVAVFSLEMGKQQLTQRILSSRSGVDSQRMRRNMLNESEFTRLHETYGELVDAPMYIDDTPGLSITQLRAKARRLASQHDVKCVLIDYLQLMTCPGPESRQQEVSEISRGVKALARELNVPVVILSQLNRNPEGRESKRPMLSDLRESGSIEQDADVVMMIHREDYYNRQLDSEYEATNEAEVIIVKQRNGPTGIVKLHFNSSTTRFENRAWGVDAEAAY